MTELRLHDGYGRPSTNRAHGIVIPGAIERMTIAEIQAGHRDDAMTVLRGVADGLAMPIAYSVPAPVGGEHRR